jgi:hypothetical protein
MNEVAGMCIMALGATLFIELVRINGLSEGLSPRRQNKKHEQAQ